MNELKKNNRAAQEQTTTLLRNSAAPRKEYIPGVRSNEQTIMMKGRNPSDPTTEYRKQTDPRRTYVPGVMSEEGTFLMHKPTADVGKTVSIPLRKKPEKKGKGKTVAVIMASLLGVIVIGCVAGAMILRGSEPANGTKPAVPAAASASAEIVEVNSQEDKKVKRISYAVEQAILRLEQNDLDGAAYSVFNIRKTIFDHFGGESVQIIISEFDKMKNRKYVIHVAQSGSKDENRAMVEVLFEDGVTGLPVAMMSFNNQGEVLYRGVFDKSSRGIVPLKDSFNWEKVMRQMQ